MKLNLVSQEVKYTFLNEKYHKGEKTRLFRNVKNYADPAKLHAFGEALVSLQTGDEYGGAVLIQHQQLDPEQA
jgi:hypothetical protein